MSVRLVTSGRLILTPSQHLSQSSTYPERTDQDVASSSACPYAPDAKRLILMSGFSIDFSAQEQPP